MWLRRGKANEMHTGMLWFDNSKATLKDKIEKATEYYFKKYGRIPDLCLIHPDMGKTEIDGIEIRPYRPVLPGHIWIGIKESE
jgi:hypothetical protein